VKAMRFLPVPATTAPPPPSSGLTPAFPPLSALGAGDHAGELEELGDRLAHQLLLAARARTVTDPVLSMLEGMPALFATFGVRVEVVRSKSGCAVVRTLPDTELGALSPCEPVAAFLEALPRVALGVPGSLIENTCVQRGTRSCLFTLLWEPQERRAASATSVAPRAPQPPRVLEATVVHLRPESPAEPSEGDAEAAIVERLPPPPAAGDAPPDGEARPVEPRSAPKRSRSHVRSRRLHVPSWLKRRGWLLVILIVAGIAGGTVAARHQAVSYQASSTLVVQSGASSTTGPGGAAEAEQLAITYATVIPTDSAILDRAASRLGISAQTLSSRLTVSVQTGTAVFVVDYKAPTQRQAVAGAAEVAQVVGGSVASSRSIPSGTVSVVHLASAASASGSLAKYGKELGGILGLVLGLILVMAAERADQRVDTAAELATVTGCPASAVLEDLSPTELSRAIAMDPAATEGVTIVPLDGSDGSSSAALATQLRSVWPSGADGAPVSVSPPFESDPVAEAEAAGPTVLVVRAGETVRRTVSVAGRLNAVHRGPVWAVLVSRRARRKLAAGAR
jgi:capsular polysaccharide biosynthesis protein